MKKPELDYRLIIILLIPTVVIAGLFLYNYRTIATGEEIEIEIVEPIDPRDLFRGQYATLRYSISRLNISEYQVEGNFSDGGTIYLSLEKKERYWRVKEIAKKSPSDSVYCIKGEIQSIQGGSIEVEYGIEEFFADPETARRIERERDSDNISGIVVIDQSCNAVLRGVMIGEEEIRTE